MCSGGSCVHCTAMCLRLARCRKEPAGNLAECAWQQRPFETACRALRARTGRRSKPRGHGVLRGERDLIADGAMRACRRHVTSASSVGVWHELAGVLGRGEQGSAYILSAGRAAHRPQMPYLHERGRSARITCCMVGYKWLWNASTLARDARKGSWRGRGRSGAGKVVVGKALSTARVPRMCDTCADVSRRTRQTRLEFCGTRWCRVRGAREGTVTPCLGESWRVSWL